MGVGRLIEVEGRAAGWWGRSAVAGAAGARATVVAAGAALGADATTRTVGGVAAEVRRLEDEQSEEVTHARGGQGEP